MVPLHRAQLRFSGHLAPLDFGSFLQQYMRTLPIMRLNNRFMIWMQATRKDCHASHSFPNQDVKILIQ